MIRQIKVVRGCSILILHPSNTKTCRSLQSERIRRSAKLPATIIYSMVRFHVNIFALNLYNGIIFRYDGVYGWRRMHWGLKVIYSGVIGCSWPLLCMFHILFPKTSIGKWASRPFMKFIVGTASYLTFLLLLVLASQVKPDGSGDDPGPPPSTIEWILLPWIISLIFRCVLGFQA